MVKVESDRDNISIAIESALAHKPTEVGDRLRSEDDLAAVFKVGRWKLRKSVDQLVCKGILVRRRGSGTYVEKIPPEASISGEPEDSGTVQPIPAQLLLARDGRNDKRLSFAGLANGRKHLQLGLWCYMYSLSPINQMILRGIVEQANGSGHQVAIHSMLDSMETPLPVSRIVDQLSDSCFDGHIVPVRWADRFVAAMGTHRAPTVYFGYSKHPIRYEPLVTIDSYEAIERAVMLLAKEGYRRIAMIGLGDPSHQNEDTSAIYERTVKKAGLDYSEAVFSRIEIGESMAVTRELLARAAPDAVYVADDYVLEGVAEALKTAGIVPGRDFGLITLSNYGHLLPRGNDWSRLEFDPEEYGRVIVNNLLRIIQVAGARIGTLTIHAAWRPGRTHCRRDGQETAD